jgi:small subunit ribosomal protein S16
MLTIRMQRTGRTGHAQFRVVAQDRRFSPTSGRVAAHLGSYDPHTKKAQLDSQKIADYLEKGAQPSPRVIRLLKTEGIKLPKWVKEPAAKNKSTRNPEKLRKNRPAEPKAEAKPSEEATEAPSTEAPAEETQSEAPANTPVEEAATEESKADEAPAEEVKVEETATEEPVAEADDEAPAEDQPAE